MDALASLLEGPRARGALVLRVLLDPPWSMRVEDKAPLTLMTIIRGSAFVTSEGCAALPLAAGDLAIVAGPTPYQLADDQATPVQVVIHADSGRGAPDVRLTDPLDESTHGWGTKAHGCSGARTWGNTTVGATTLLVGTYRLRNAVGNRLIGALPPLSIVRGFGRQSGFVALLAEEIDKEGPGQEVVLDRLLDLLLVSALRTWFSQPDSGAPRWYQAAADPVIGGALRMLVENPAHAWTVAGLAAAAGLSRAALARRFTELVGEPPMTFLAGWRLEMAADLLLNSDCTLDAVARQVGYGSSYALSTAFKRAHGISPQQHRLAAAAS